MFTTRYARRLERDLAAARDSYAKEQQARHDAEALRDHCTMLFERERADRERERAEAADERRRLLAEIAKLHDAILTRGIRPATAAAPASLVAADPAAAAEERKREPQPSPPSPRYRKGLALAAERVQRQQPTATPLPPRRNGQPVVNAPPPAQLDEERAAIDEVIAARD